MQGNERLLMLCNPQNPGGTVYRREELEAQLAFAQQHDLIVCSDEIHCDLILSPDARHIPFAALSDDAAQRSITLISPSKTFNIAGLGASMAIIPNPELRKRFKQVREGIVPGVDILALVAAEAAWREGDAWLEAQIDYLRANRDWLVAQVNALPELQMNSPEATYLGWIDASQLDVASPALYFEKHGLGFSPGRDFGDDNFVRLTSAARAPYWTGGEPIAQRGHRPALTLLTGDNLFQSPWMKLDGNLPSVTASVGLGNAHAHLLARWFDEMPGC
uniref:cysteine-S-conjugate beta-lyase n=1 Tax=Acyrthosiphon pisum TaxID=7029 RepID=A0A8R2BAQ5_ACYPI